MKNIKKLFLVAIIFLLCGCSVEYDLTINNDLSVNEKVIAKENTNRMKVKTSLDEKESVNYLYKMFDREGLKTTISSKTSGNDTIASVTGSHDSLEDFVSNFSSDIFSVNDIEKDGSIVTLTFNQEQVLDSNLAKSPVYDDIVVNITVPFEVTYNNASSVKKNTYTWKINKDEEKKQIKISFDEEKYKNKLKVKIGDNTVNISYGIIVLASLIGIILFIILFVYINNKRHNRV